MSLTPDKYLTDKELLETKRRIGCLKEREQVLFLILLSTGIRISEALALNKSSIIESRQSIKVKALKGSKDREITIEESLFNRLIALPKNGPKGNPFPYSVRWAQLQWDIVRPDGKKLHSLRHTFAVNLYRKSRDIKLVQYALGHRSLTNTTIYTEIDQADRLREMLKNA
jgi:integrase/recombinase XerC